MSSSGASAEFMLGPDPGSFYASIVRRVLELALDPGHPDPRHSEHWWAWADWPLDGRQWDRIDGSFKLDRGALSEHKERGSLEGALGSKLKVERKLEGIIWDTDRPRTAIRSTGVFDECMIEPMIDNESDGNSDDEDDVFRWMPIAKAARMSGNRKSWDAAVSPKGAQMKVKVSDEAGAQFESEEPFRSFLDRLRSEEPDDMVEALGESDSTLILDVTFYFCTDAFATKDEQNAMENGLSEDIGTPSVCVHAGLLYFDARKDGHAMLHVVGEAPISAVEDNVQNRVAGFVIQDELEGDLPVAHSSTSGKAVRITYVEASGCDYEPLTDSQKDSVLEDRALIVHRLMEQVALQKGTLAPLTVRTPRFGSKVPVGLPPTRILKCYSGVTRGDPRWPLVPPNSVCLECGKGPKRPEGEECVKKLMECSKCRTRKFCSNECLKKSWKSDIYPHRYECKKAHEDDLYSVGTSLRQKYREIGTPEGERLVEEMFAAEGKKDVFDKKAETLEELHSQRKMTAKKERRDARKKKGKQK